MSIEFRTPFFVRCKLKKFIMLCRLCLLDCEDLIDIFEGQGVDLNINSIIEQHFGIELRKDDKISRKICSTCWLEIENFHVFFVDIQRAQERLQRQLSICLDGSQRRSTTDNVQKKHAPPREQYDQSLAGLLGNIEQDFSNVSGDIDVFAAPSTTNRRENLYRKRVSVNFDKSSPDVVVVDIETPEYDDMDDCSGINEYTPIDFCAVDYNDQEEEEDESEHEYINSTLDIFPDLSKILQRDEISITPMPGFSFGETKEVTDDEKIRKYIQLKCEHCDSEFEIFAELKQHYRGVHKISGYAVCCNQKFFKRIQLMEHIMRHTNPDVFRLSRDKHFAVKKLQKSSCDKSYVKMCRYCRRIFRNKKQYENHVREHNANKPSRVQCKQCTLWFKSRRSLQEHIKFHVDQTDDFVCSLCGRKAISDISLHRHIRNVHYKERKYQCILCGKAFKWSINLKEHMAIHTGESLYRCKYCPKTFNASSNLHSHRKKIHRVEWEKERRMRLDEERQKRIDSNSSGNERN